MRPDESSARERAEKIMDSPMYVDTNQVKLSKDNGDIAWVVNALSFEAVVSYKERDVQRIKYKSTLGDFEIILKDYWLANGTHLFPKLIIVKTIKGELYHLETLGLRYYEDSEESLQKRLTNWDKILKNKPSTDIRPGFLL
jgi:hypothetical protein